jgi:alpha-tubulin suppressor-like RCC1 family protein
MTRNDFRTPDGDIENESFITEEWLVDQWIGDQLWGWGINDSNQLGINAPGGRTTPVTTFAGGANWKQISACYDFAAAIKTDGTLWTWGSNIAGELGTNDTVYRSTPVTTFAGGTNWKSVSCGFDHISAIKTDGSLWTWGGGTSGSLGTNNTTDISTPVTTFAGGNDWKQVSSGNGYTSAIKTDGTLWTWGYNFYGQLGTNNTTTRSTPVTTSAGGNNWKQVSAGGVHVGAIKTDGTLWMWGANDSGCLGNFLPNSGTCSSPTTTIAGGNDWKQINCSMNKTVGKTAAIKTDGTLWYWGYSYYGESGAGQGSGYYFRLSSPVTTQVGGNNWKQVAAGTRAIKKDGTLWVWGDGRFGASGTNVSFSSSSPRTTFLGGNNWKQVVDNGNNTVFGVTSGPDY